MEIIMATWIMIASAADVSNERIPVTGAELEQHWRLDCGGMLDDYNNRIVLATGSGISKISKGELRELADVAQKCSFIYSQKGTGRTISCPDYQRVSDILQDMVLGGNATKPTDPGIEKCD